MALHIKNLDIDVGGFNMCNVEIEITNGEYFILMGHTGSGKSLLMKSICGIQEIMRGEILINGEDVIDVAPETRGLGYVPQDSCLLPHLDVSANIKFGLDLLGFSRDEIEVNFQEVVDDLGINYLLDRNIGTLSGGERQKTALARAIIRKPVLLLLDEPVSALDEAAREEVCQLLLQVHKKYKFTTLHICHNRDEAHMMGDRIGIMNAGELIAIGSATELKEMCDDPIVSKLFKQEWSEDNG